MKIYDNSIFETESNKRMIDLVLFILLDIVLIGVGLCLIFTERNRYISIIFLSLGVIFLILTIIYIISKVKADKKLLESTFGVILHDVESKEIKNILTNLKVDINNVDCRILKRESLLSIGILYNEYCYSELLLTKNNYYFSLEPMEEYFHLVNLLPKNISDLIGSDNKLQYDNKSSNDIYRDWIDFTNNNKDNAKIISDAFNSLHQDV